MVLPFVEVRSHGLRDSVRCVVDAHGRWSLRASCSSLLVVNEQERDSDFFGFYFFST